MVVKKKKKKRRLFWRTRYSIYHTTTTKVGFGEEKVPEIKVHPDFDKFSGEVFFDIMFGSVPSFQVPQKTYFSLHFERNKPPRFFLFFFFLGGGGLQSSKIYFTINTYWMPWCAPFFDHHRHSEPSFQTIWFCPFFHPREIVKANHLFLLTIENVCVMKTKYKPIEMQPTSL